MSERLLNERRLSTGEQSTLEYVTLPQSFHAGTLSNTRTGIQTFNLTFFRSVFKTTMFRSLISDYDNVKFYERSL